MPLTDGLRYRSTVDIVETAQVAFRFGDYPEMMELRYSLRELAEKADELIKVLVERNETLGA
jgi:hypothetical protein